MKRCVKVWETNARVWGLDDACSKKAGSKDAAMDVVDEQCGDDGGERKQTKKMRGREALSTAATGRPGSSLACFYPL